MELMNLAHRMVNRNDPNDEGEQWDLSNANTPAYENVGICWVTADLESIGNAIESSSVSNQTWFTTNPDNSSRFCIPQMECYGPACDGSLTCLIEVDRRYREHGRLRVCLRLPGHRAPRFWLGFCGQLYLCVPRRHQLRRRYH